MSMYHWKVDWRKLMVLTVSETRFQTMDYGNEWRSAEESNPIPCGTICFRNSPRTIRVYTPWRMGEDSNPNASASDCFQGSFLNHSEYPSDLAEGGGLDPHSNWNRTISSRLREPSRFTLRWEMMMIDCWTFFSLLMKWMHCISAPKKSTCIVLYDR